MNTGVTAALGSLLDPSSCADCFLRAFATQSLFVRERCTAAGFPTQQRSTPNTYLPTRSHLQGPRRRLRG